MDDDGDGEIYNITDKDFIILERKLWQKKIQNEFSLLTPNERRIIIIKEIRELVEILQEHRKAFKKVISLIPFPELDRINTIRKRENSRFNDYQIRPVWVRFTNALDFLSESEILLKDFLEENHNLQLLSLLDINNLRPYEEDEPAQMPTIDEILSKCYDQTIKIEEPKSPNFNSTNNLQVDNEIAYTSPPIPNKISQENQNEPSNDNQIEKIKEILLPYLRLYTETLFEQKDQKYNDFNFIKLLIATYYHDLNDAIKKAVLCGDIEIKDNCFYFPHRKKKKGKKIGFHDRGSISLFFQTGGFMEWKTLAGHVGVPNGESIHYMTEAALKAKKNSLKMTEWNNIIKPKYYPNSKLVNEVDYKLKQVLNPNLKD